MIFLVAALVCYFRWYEISPMSCVLVVFEVEILLRWFQLKQVSLPSLGEPYREGKDSCRVFILYMHILYLHELVLIAKWLTRGMIIFADG